MPSKNKLRKALIFAWVSNTSMGIIEMLSWILSGSSSLVLDALDFIFDGVNYFSSIYALNKSEKLKTIFWKVKGWIMILTGIVIFAWIIYKYISGRVPNGITMSILWVLALWVNIISTVLISKYKDESLDIQAVWLCTRNDAINNILILVAWIITLYFNSIYPDIIISFWMWVIVILSWMRIVKWGNIDKHWHSHWHSHKH